MMFIKQASLKKNSLFMSYPFAEKIILKPVMVHLQIFTFGGWESFQNPKLLK